MSCTVKRSNTPNKEITAVLTKNGADSKLFKEIASYPFVQNTEQGLQIYKNTYSKVFKDINEDDMVLSHQVNGENFSTVKDALKSAKENQEISVGITANNKFTELITIPKNTDMSNEVGFIQSNILNGNISENRVRVGNNYNLDPYGESNNRKQASLSVLRENVPQGFVINQDGTSFTLQPTNVVEMVDKRGNVMQVTVQELENMSDEQIRKTFDNAEPILANRLYRQNVPVSRELLPTPQPIIKGDEELSRNLLSLLKKMGINVVAMDNYIANYNLRNGVNPNAEALADISNQVVAILSGQETVENLLEETVHFIVEALPQERIENILRNINKSEEYKQHYQIQRAIYESEYSSEELENVVRREILGKIITNAITQTEEKSETQQNFFENAKRLISEFFKNIVNYFKTEYQIELNNLLDDVRKLIESQDISELTLSNFKENQSRFYNASGNDLQSPLVREALKIVKVMTKLERDLNKVGKGNALNTKELRKVQEDLKKAEDILSIAKVNEIAENTVRILEAALRDSVENNKGFSLSQEENVAYQNLKGEVSKGLSVLRQLLIDKSNNNNSNNNNSNNKILIEKLAKTIESISVLEAKEKVLYNDLAIKSLRENTTDKGLSEKDFDLMMQWYDRAEKDINFMNMTFGTLGASSDYLLKSAAMLRTAMYSRQHRDSHQETKELQAELRKFGKDERYIATIVKDREFISERNTVQYAKDREQNFTNAYNSVFKDNKLTTEELLKKRMKGELTWTAEEQNQIELLEQKANDLIDEKRMERSYYDELEVKYNTVNSSEYTREILRALNTQKNRIRERAKDGNGIEDISALSQKDIEELKILDQKRKSMKSPIDTDGTMKNGLKFIKVDGKQILALDDVEIDELEPESRIAYDISKLDGYTSEVNEKRINELLKNTNRTSTEDKELVALTTEKERPASFDRLVLSKASKSEQVRALELNANIGFTAEFWETFNNTETIVQKLENYKANNPESAEVIDQYIQDIEDIKNREKALIRMHTKANNPTETNVEAMSETTKNTLKELAEDSEDIRNAIKLLLKEPSVQLTESEGVSESNESWQKKVKDLDEADMLSVLNGDVAYDKDSHKTNLEDFIESIRDEAIKNSTRRNGQAILDAYVNVRQIAEGKSTRVSKSVENALQSQGMTKDDLDDDLKRAKFLKAFFESRTLSYYKSFTPQSYLDFKADLSNDNVTMAEVLGKDYKYLKITPNYSFDEEDISRKNPNYIQNAKMGYTQPSMGKYENKEFTAKFGKVVRDKNGYYVSSEKNAQEFGAYKAVMNFRFRQLEYMDAGNGYNYYMTMQMRKNTLERVYGGVGNLSEKVKNGWENLTQYTEDDQISGDESFGTNNKIIPKQYFAKLENQSDVTEDYFYALILTNNAANMYKSRTKFYGEYMALRNIAHDRQTEGNVETSATNRFKMFDSSIDYDLYGIKKVANDKVMGQNIGKAVDSLGAFLRFKGLGGSLIIPATAYLTGTTKQFTERMIGQYYNKDSFNRGAKEYRKQLGKAFSEAGKVNTTAEMTVKGEFWQAFDSEERLYGSAFGDLKRFSSKISMITYQMANYPIYGKNMYNVLHDFRIVDGKFMKFTDFKRAELNKDYKKTKQEIESDWAKIENTINDYHTASESGQIVWDKVQLIKLLKNKDGNQFTDDELEDELLKIADDVRRQIKSLNVNSDMQLSKEDKVAAERHWLLKYLLAFKGFMIPLYESRFKKTEMNPDSRQIEGGSYSGLYELARDIMKDWKKNGGNFMDAMRRQYNGDFSVEKARIDELKALGDKRTAKESEELRITSENLVRAMEDIEQHRNNLKRLGIDMLVIQGAVALMLLLRGFADDDDNKDNYALQMAALLSQRLAGEINTANLNIASNYYDVASNPLSGFRMLTDVAKFPKAYDKGELGYTVAKAWLPFVSSVEQMQDPQKARDNMRYYSEVKSNAYWSVPLYNILEEDDLEE